MPIRKHLTDKTAFGPVTIEAMSKAFEEACIALQVFAGDEKGREIIATRIIDLARGGVVDAAALLIVWWQRRALANRDRLRLRQRKTPARARRIPQKWHGVSFVYGSRPPTASEARANDRASTSLSS
jgi:hypothetical protein